MEKVMASIECTNFRACEKGFLVGFATIYVEKWGTEISGLTVWKKDGKRWINMPSTEYMDKDTGEKKYKQVIYFRNKDHAALFLEEARKAVDLCVAKMAEAPSVPDNVMSIDEDGVPF